jgi:hypothetical protein
MKEKGHSSEQKIMPQDLLECYIKSRKNTYASGKEPILGLNVRGFKGYRDVRYPYYYQDNYRDDQSRPGNFSGFEQITEGSYEGQGLTLYTYAGGLTEDGLKLQEQTEKGLRNGESVVYSRLVKFLGDHVSDVRFGKTVRFEFRDSLGKWVYEGKGRIEGHGWEDDEFISLNGVQMYKLRGTGQFY